MESSGLLLWTSPAAPWRASSVRSGNSSRRQTARAVLRSLTESIHLRRCLWRAPRQGPHPPRHRPVALLPSGRRYRSLWRTSCLRNSLSPSAVNHVRAPLLPPSSPPSPTPSPNHTCTFNWLFMLTVYALYISTVYWTLLYIHALFALLVRW